MTEIMTIENEGDAADQASIFALADRLDLCSDFDRKMYREYGWARRKPLDPTWAELRTLAHDSGYGGSFDEAFPKGWDRPAVPAVGDTLVELKMKDGSTQVGRVTNVAEREDKWNVTLKKEGSGASDIFFLFKQGSRFKSYTPEGYAIEAITEVYECPTVPNVSDRVRLIQGDGMTYEGVIRDVRRDEGSRSFPHAYWHIEMATDGGTPVVSNIFADRAGVDAWRPSTTAKSIKVIGREWKAGDIVPAGTVVGKWWLFMGESGVPLRVAPDDSLSSEHKMLWIDTEEEK